MRNLNYLCQKYEIIYAKIYLYNHNQLDHLLENKTVILLSEFLLLTGRFKTIKLGLSTQFIH